jgi:hypothetical protein
MDSRSKGQLRQQYIPFLKAYRNPVKKRKGKQLGIFYDITKAYDAINHNILLAK